MNTLPILSICIPTFNRAAFLTGTLNAITSQLNEDTYSKIEVIISDNASPDNTEQIINDFITNHSQIQIIYFRQLNNIGADRNVNKVISLATGQYIYVLSDDDVLLPNAINRILSLVAHNPTIDAFCLNIVTFSINHEDATPPIFNITTDYITHNHDESLVFLGSWITFLSAMVFKKEPIIGKNYEDKMAIGFIHSHIFLDVLAQNGKLYVTNQPYLAVRGGNTSGFSFFKVFISDFSSLLNYAEEIGYSKSTIKQVLSKHRKFIYTFVLTFKIHGRYGGLQPDYQEYVNGIKRLVKVYYHDPVFLLFIILFIMTPQILLQQMYRIYSFIKTKFR